MNTHEQLETILQRAEVPDIYWPGLIEALEGWKSAPATDPVWCEHIEWDEVGQESGWWFLVPFNNIMPVPYAWKTCPVCSTARPHK